MNFAQIKKAGTGALIISGCTFRLSGAVSPNNEVGTRFGCVYVSAGYLLASGCFTWGDFWTANVDRVWDVDASAGTVVGCIFEGVAEQANYYIDLNMASGLNVGNIFKTISDINWSAKPHNRAYSTHTGDPRSEFNLDI